MFFYIFGYLFAYLAVGGLTFGYYVESTKPRLPDGGDAAICILFWPLVYCTVVGISISKFVNFVVGSK